jgi:hypothetical protein
VSCWLSPRPRLPARRASTSAATSRTRSRSCRSIPASTISTFDDRTWYYISKRTETTAFFDPDVTDQEVLAINFDESGVVQNMRVYGQEDGRTIAYVDRTTPTEGNELTLIQQLLGNLGRFNPEGDERAN